MFDRSWEAVGPATGRWSVRRTASTGNVFRAARDRFQSWTAQKLRPRSRFSYVVPRSEDIDLK
jgi:hypothetical protein